MSIDMQRATNPEKIQYAYCALLRIKTWAFTGITESPSFRTVLVIGEKDSGGIISFRITITPENLVDGIFAKTNGRNPWL